MIPGQTFADFYERAGFTVRQLDGVFWYSQSSAIFRSLPVSRHLDLGLGKAEAVAETLGVSGVEYTLDGGRGLSSGHHVLRDKHYGMHALQRQFRQNVRRGHETCRICEIDWKDLYRDGFQCNLDSLARQHRYSALFSNKHLWRRYCQAGETLSDSGVFGCFSGNSLVAWLSFLVEEDTCHGLSMMSRSASGARGGNHALYFAFAKSMIQQDGIACVSLGLCANPPAPTRDAFKRHLGFVAEPCDTGIALRRLPRKLMATKGGAALLRTMSRTFPKKWDPERMEAVITTARAMYEFQPGN